jgi:hypothetical protein
MRLRIIKRAALEFQDGMYGILYVNTRPTYRSLLVATVITLVTSADPDQTALLYGLIKVCTVHYLLHNLKL